ncbi:helix-turn-helix transcriptional regulator [Fischerella sp. PCC 9605]|uniref:helix-turn-helix transcriptional regulator n=1 Tax=Fischerella sp. PCC 9605 TaxID=1173024 RepID=UPI000479607A|nr:LuxR C-terminal-related transcriptional regulator [Fischerella sp. PCC 9605]
MIAFTKISAKSSVEIQKQDNITLNYWQQAYFLQEVIEGLQDGLLIISETGELIHANASAHRICCQLNQGSYRQNQVPTVIWRICESLIESRNLFPNKLLILSDEILLDKSKIFRIRVRWLDLARLKHSCLLVTIENRYESVRNAAIAEIKQYNLTRREAEIWCLYRANYSYKEIAAHFYISINTVKKHMKNIHAKRQAYLENA